MKYITENHHGMERFVRSWLTGKLGNKKVHTLKNGRSYQVLDDGNVLVYRTKENIHPKDKKGCFIQNKDGTTKTEEKIVDEVLAFKLGDTIVANAARLQRCTNHLKSPIKPIQRVFIATKTPMLPLMFLMKLI